MSGSSNTQVLFNKKIKTDDSVSISPGAFSLHKVVRKRRAIKHFSPDIEVADATVERWIQLSSYAPSVFNLQHWKVIHLKSQDVRRLVAAQTYFQPQVLQASAVLAIVMDIDVWARPELMTGNCSSLLGQVNEQKRIRSIYQHNPTLARDEAMRSCAMFAMILMLAVEADGYSSCPLTGCDYEAIGHTLSLKSNQELCMLIALGKESPENSLLPQWRRPCANFVTEL